MSKLFSAALLVATLLNAPQAFADTPRPGGGPRGGGAHFDYHGQDFRGLAPAGRAVAGLTASGSSKYR